MFLRINMAQAKENDNIHEKYEAVSASDERKSQILEAHEDHIGDQQNEILGFKAIIIYDSEKLKVMEKSLLGIFMPSQISQGIRCL